MAPPGRAIELKIKQKGMADSFILSAMSFLHIDIHAKGKIATAEHASGKMRQSVVP